MKRFVLFLALAASLSLGVQAQTVLKSPRELVFENIERAGNTTHRYEALDTVDTPAPKGYTPFYISHIGRHGSRFQLNEKVYTKRLEKLAPYKDAGQLTETGLRLYYDIAKLLEVSEGNYGKLTAIGAQEHREISRRMYNRFPEVFNQGDRKKVETFSTTSGRVLESRRNFLEVLGQNAPGLEIEEYDAKGEYAGRKVSEIVSGRKVTDEEKARIEGLKRSIKYPENPCEPSWRRLAGLIFTNPDEISDRKVKSLMTDVALALQSAQCISDTLRGVKAYFTPDEIYSSWYRRNIGAYAGNWCINSYNKGIFVKRVIPILRNWIDMADEAVKGNGVAADLRFSHDVYVQPLLSLIGATGNSFICAPEDIGDNYCCFTSISMGTNIQMIFYHKPGSKKVLVKILHNEREVVIPSLKKTDGVYHDWNQLKAYLEKRINRLSAEKL